VEKVSKATKVRGPEERVKIDLVVMVLREICPGCREKAAHAVIRLIEGLK
jgi:hypothetical protein